MAKPGRKPKTLPRVSGDHALGHWCINSTKVGEIYPRFTSGKYAGEYVHRAIFEEVAGRPPKEGMHMHHMNGVFCFCPHQLLECPAVFNVKWERPRHPYTGRFISRDEYEREFGEGVPF